MRIFRGFTVYALKSRHRTLLGHTAITTDVKGSWQHSSWSLRDWTKSTRYNVVEQHPRSNSFTLHESTTSTVVVTL